MAKKITQAQFADLLEVSRPLINKALKTGRLTKSVTRTDQGDILIDVVAGVMEFYNNANLAKDNNGDHIRPHAPTSSQQGHMPLDESNEMERHYSALLKQLDYLERAKTLMPADKYKLETFQAFRTTRDALLYMPQALIGEIKSKMIDLIRQAFGDEAVANTQKAIEVASGELKVSIKGEMKKALFHISSKITTHDAQPELLIGGPE